MTLRTTAAGGIAVLAADVFTTAPQIVTDKLVDKANYTTVAQGFLSSIGMG